MGSGADYYSHLNRLAEHIVAQSDTITRLDLIGLIKEQAPDPEQWLDLITILAGMAADPGHIALVKERYAPKPLKDLRK